MVYLPRLIELPSVIKLKKMNQFENNASGFMAVSPLGLIPSNPFFDDSEVGEIDPFLDINVDAPASASDPNVEALAPVSASDSVEVLAHASPNTYLTWLLSVACFMIFDLPGTAVRVVHSMHDAANSAHFLLTPSQRLWFLGSTQETATDVYLAGINKWSLLDRIINFDLTFSACLPNYHRLLPIMAFKTRITLFDRLFRACLPNYQRLHDANLPEYYRLRDQCEHRLHLQRSDERASSPVPGDGNWRPWFVYLDRPLRQDGEPENDEPPCEHYDCLQKHYLEQCGDLSVDVEWCPRPFSPWEPEIHCPHCFICVRKPSASDAVIRPGDNVFMPAHWRLMYMEQVPEEHRKIIYDQQLQQYALSKRISDATSTYDPTLQNDMNIQRRAFVEKWWPKYKGVADDKSVPSDIRLPSLGWTDKSRWPINADYRDEYTIPAFFNGMGIGAYFWEYMRNSCVTEEQRPAFEAEFKNLGGEIIINDKGVSAVFKSQYQREGCPDEFFHGYCAKNNCTKTHSTFYGAASIPGLTRPTAFRYALHEEVIDFRSGSVSPSNISDVPAFRQNASSVISSPVISPPVIPVPTFTSLGVHRIIEEMNKNKPAIVMPSRVSNTATSSESMTSYILPQCDQNLVWGDCGDDLDDIETERLSVRLEIVRRLGLHQFFSASTLEKFPAMSDDNIISAISKVDWSAPPPDDPLPVPARQSIFARSSPTSSGRTSPVLPASVLPAPVLTAPVPPAPVTPAPVSDASSVSISPASAFSRPASVASSRHDSVTSSSRLLRWDEAEAQGYLVRGRGLCARGFGCSTPECPLLHMPDQRRPCETQDCSTCTLWHPVLDRFLITVINADGHKRDAFHKEGISALPYAGVHSSLRMRAPASPGATGAASRLAPSGRTRVSIFATAAQRSAARSAPPAPSVQVAPTSAAAIVSVAPVASVLTDFALEQVSARSTAPTPSASVAAPALYNNPAFSFKRRGEGAVPASASTHYNNPAFSFKGRGEVAVPAHYSNSAFSFNRDGGSGGASHFNNPAFNMGKNRTQDFFVSGPLPPATSSVPISDGAAPEDAHAILMEQARIARAARAEDGVVESAPVYVSVEVNPNERQLKSLRKSLRELLDKVNASYATPSAESARTRILRDLGCTLIFPDADRQRVIAKEVLRKIATLENASVEDLDQFAILISDLGEIDLRERVAAAAPVSVMPHAAPAPSTASTEFKTVAECDKMVEDAKVALKECQRLAKIATSAVPAAMSAFRAAESVMESVEKACQTALKGPEFKKAKKEGWMGNKFPTVVACRETAASLARVEATLDNLSEEASAATHAVMVATAALKSAETERSAAVTNAARLAAKSKSNVSTSVAPKAPKVSHDDEEESEREAARARALKGKLNKQHRSGRRGGGGDDDY